MKYPCDDDNKLAKHNRAAIEHDLMGFSEIEELSRSYSRITRENIDGNPLIHI